MRWLTIFVLLTVSLYADHVYKSPLVVRYASKDMSELFSLYNKRLTWRKMWIALAQAQKELGLVITQNQIDEMQQSLHEINFETIDAYEKQLRHDVMANVHAFGDQCPAAKPIIHLGATSCTITDNSDMLIMRDAIKKIEHKLIVLLEKLAHQATQYKSVACLGFTHGQPAQPTTVGKRICLWLQDLLFDVHNLKHVDENLYFLGIKGATGTQASFLELFDGDHDKVRQLDQNVAAQLGFSNVISISGQTYTRKQDVLVLDTLKHIAMSAHKMCTDIRLLSMIKEIEEPFGKKQIGSSAMPYKCNPMKCERTCSLARYVMSLSQNPVYTAAIQWLERSLDDSANRRLCIPEAFLATDGILNLLITIIDGLRINEPMIEKHLQNELPFMASEQILMSSVKRGGDRQVVHERLRQHSMQTAYAIKKEGKSNNLISRIAKDAEIPLDEKELYALLKPNEFVGRATEQVIDFIKDHVDPVVYAYKKLQSESIDTGVNY